ncbi:excisionase family DNA-binding protein [Ruegeria profundi]|uniref:excisionase family DNA-binding protein n=1 Tax=Ruegeria profundi TaxID=1685378 RepID=UPI003C7D99D1
MSGNTAEVVDITKRMPTREEIQNAGDGLAAIESVMNGEGQLPIGEVYLSPALTDLIRGLLGIVSRGETVTYMPQGRMLSTQQAADILNVSRSYVLKLIERQELYHEMVGTHRRVPFIELMNYKEQRSAARSEALDDLLDFTKEFEAE